MDSLECRSSFVKLNVLSPENWSIVEMHQVPESGRLNIAVHLQKWVKSPKMDDLAFRILFVKINEVPENGRFLIPSSFEEMQQVPENGRLRMLQFVSRNGLSLRTSSTWHETFHFRSQNLARSGYIIPHTCLSYHAIGLIRMILPKLAVSIVLAFFICAECLLK